MRVGTALMMVPNTTKKGPMAVSLSETSHAGRRPDIGTQDDTQTRPKGQDSGIDQCNRKRDDGAAGLDNGGRERADQYTP